MKSILLGLVAIAVGTMWLFNFSSGIIGGLWLVFTGGLGVVISGFIASIIMPFVYSIALLPQLLLATLLMKVSEKGYRFISAILIFIIAFYGNFLLALWVSSTFDWLMTINDLPPVALWLWTYSIVMSPISYMASKEPPDSTGTSLGLLFTQISFFILSFALLLGNLSIGYLWLWVFLFLYSILAASLGFYAIPKKEKKHNSVIHKIDEAEVIPAYAEEDHSKSHSIKYCSDCGKQIPIDSKFCKYCGQKIK